jgi:hypothetical protein
VNVDEQLAAVQASQFGLMTMRQLPEAGCSYKALRRRVRTAS